ncbi:hypothetical protein FV226_08465 [Methylobacterium sp. WL12]|nr:hypothetical protein FV226_08465 [Methylobacterium sp. WL12]
MPIITKRPSVSKSGYEFQPVGTQSAKDTIYRRLTYAVGSAESIHAPEHLRNDALWDQVAAESLHCDDKGRTWWAVTKEGTSNEAIDCLVYGALSLRKLKSCRVMYASTLKTEVRASTAAPSIGAFHSLKKTSKLESRNPILNKTWIILLRISGTIAAFVNCAEPISETFGRKPTPFQAWL